MAQDFIVLGGGIAGLATAYELLKRGHRVRLIERSSEVGGLARTFEREGFRFDIGGHRFHSNNPSVVQWLKDLLKEDLLVVPRVSHIHLNGRFAEYPIVFPQALTIFSPIKAVEMIASYLLAKVREARRADVSFEDWVVRRYGWALYRVFFEPYTEKVWGIPCTELSAAWAAQRIGIPSMWRAIKHALVAPKEQLATAISHFYYPRAGFGMFPAALAREIAALGGRIDTDTSLLQCTPLEVGGFEVTSQHKNGQVETLTADHVVSTIPLNYLLQAIPDARNSPVSEVVAQLEYRDIMCLFVALRSKQVSGDSWTYFPAKELVFGRTHEPKNWSPEMVPDMGYTSLAIEIFASRGEPIWALSDEALLAKVVEQMDGIGWFKAADVHRSWVLRVPYAYPVYRIGYEEQLTEVHRYLSQWPNLHLVGRTGSFRYMNSDGVIEDVFRFISELTPDTADQSAPVQTLAGEVGRWV